MEELISLISSNGIGIVCVAYLIHFQNTTLKEMVATLNSISQRLLLIEQKVSKND